MKDTLRKVLSVVMIFIESKFTKAVLLIRKFRILEAFE
ncbi:hypothetical protein FVER14953_20481 [Fusarium verticillioides]|nr:hypothetical protein FVER14953_20481 [Fusarium verticillioides]